MRYLNLAKNISNWWVYLQIKCHLKNDDPLLFKTRKGLWVCVPRDLLHTFKEIYMEECYIHGLHASKIPHDAVIIDIGANAGYFSLFAASRFPHSRIFAFEPIPANFRILKGNMDLNENSRIFAFEQAVGGQAGNVTMTYSRMFPVTTEAAFTGLGHDQGETITVSCTTIKDILDDHHIEKCDVLKMDCEGAEYDIIYHCPPDYLKRVRQIVMEVHNGSDVNHRPGHLKDYLQQHHFTLYETPKALGMLWALNNQAI